MTADYQEVIPPELEGWTKDEKYDLLLGIKHYGFHYDELRKRVPTKTVDQIKKVVDYYSYVDNMPDDKISLRQMRRNRKHEPQVPLAEWAELLTSTNDYKDLHTDCAKALRIIADHEKFPNPAHIDGVDFRKIYHCLADAMEGKPIPDDPIVAEVFKYCISEASELSKGIIPPCELQNLCQLMARGDGSVNIPFPTKDGGLQAIQTLMCQRNYNPLRVSEEYLKYPPKYTDDVPDV